MTSPQDNDAASVQHEADVHQFVTFMAGDEVFAVDMQPVQEIIRVPEVVRVPLAPPALNGLANLRGKVLPIISLRRVFGYAGRADDDATRALVIDLGQPLGFVVDRVASVVEVDARQIEDAAGLGAAAHTELVSGLIKNVGGHAMVMVLDFARLIASEFAQVAAASQRALQDGSPAGTGADAEDEHTDELQLVSFDVAGQEYAVPIEDVQEIVQTPEQIVQVPQALPHVLGLMLLRSRLLPLVSLRRLFGLPDRAADEQSRVVVVACDGSAVGLVTDSVNEVLRVPRDVVDAMPALLAREPGMADIPEICRLDDGRRLVAILSAATMFRQNAIRAALQTVDHMNPDDDHDAGRADEQPEDEEQLVVFRLGREEFGVPIGSVQEIVRVPELLTQVPQAPAFVEGVINLRGAVLPVIDLRRRLGMEAAERSDRQRIMVFLIDSVCTGFIVDSVAEVLKVERRAIEPAPRLSPEQSLLLARMANLEAQQRMVQLLEPRHLVAGNDLAELASLAG